ncbi:MAG TPA: CAP domain-containing protein [Candidatus Polarisedimenticolaceae bacterium]|nr:CAP domain-containing protein [Candidatus Polarisedimenticolaceae bacterium]
MIASVLLAGLAALAPDAAPFEDAIVSQLLADVQRARREVGAVELRREAALDGVARDQVIAEDDHESEGVIDAALRTAGVRRFRRAWLYRVSERGSADPAATLLSTWRGDPAWWHVVAAGVNRVGLSVRDDGTDVRLAVVLLEDTPVPSDLDALERRTAEAVNEARRAQGLAPLEFDGTLARVARGHSADMARRNYFDHRSPEGTGPGDRVRAGGLSYQGIAENILRVLGQDDPVATALGAWMESAGHRANLLSARYRLTGVGVAVDDDGAVLITQLFAQPFPGPPARGR